MYIVWGHSENLEGCKTIMNLKRGDGCGPATVRSLANITICKWWNARWQIVDLLLRSWMPANTKKVLFYWQDVFKINLSITVIISHVQFTIIWLANCIVIVYNIIYSSDSSTPGHSPPTVFSVPFSIHISQGYFSYFKYTFALSVITFWVMRVILMET